MCSEMLRTERIDVYYIIQEIVIYNGGKINNKYSNRHLQDHKHATADAQ
jgi:hypothetical protein